jgi:hypothetical protein
MTRTMEPKITLTLTSEEAFEIWMALSRRVMRCMDLDIPNVQKVCEDLLGRVGDARAELESGRGIRNQPPSQRVQRLSAVEL